MIAIVSALKRILFSAADLDQFAAATGDRNPLHLSESYARHTSFGQPVVHGCLGMAACLSCVDLPRTMAITRVEAFFHRPIFLNMDYEVRKSGEGGEIVAALVDGGIRLAHLKLRVEPGEAPIAEMPSTAGLNINRVEPRIWRAGDFSLGTEISGSYSVDPKNFAALLTRWPGADPFAVYVLAFAGYFTGMEFPGEGALLAKVSCDLNASARSITEMDFRARLKSLDERLGKLSTEFSLSRDGAIAAQGECSAFVKRPLPSLHRRLPEFVGSTLKGRTVAITGASRGFGAAIKCAIEARGAHVYHVSRSCEQQPTDRTVLGDAKEPAVLDELRRLIVKDQGRLDFLICNAFPTPRPLRLEPAALGRIAEYLTEAVMTTLSPLCMLLETLNESSGVIVLISSAWVESPVREWPHYLAAKSASEMLARVASIQFPDVRTLIVRPGKMQTAWTNTPLGWSDAKPVQEFAERLAERLEHPIDRGATEILEMD